MQESGELADGVDPDTAAAALLAAYQGGVLLASGTGDLGALRLALTTFQTTVLIDRHR